MQVEITQCEQNLRVRCFRGYSLPTQQMNYTAHMNISQTTVKHPTYKYQEYIINTLVNMYISVVPDELNFPWLEFLCYFLFITQLLKICKLEYRTTKFMDIRSHRVVYTYVTDEISYRNVKSIK